MIDNRKLLSEVLRPQHLDDLTLPQRDIDRLGRMLNSGNIMNMIFYGRPGLGKTSAARVIIKHLEAHADSFTYEVNGSSGKGADDVRKINEYASIGSLNVGPTICFIDEADFLSPNAQASIRSRMKAICFDIATSDRSEVIGRLVQRYQEQLTQLGIEYDEKRLKEIVGIYFPDLRAIANEFEYEFATGGEPLAA